MLDLFGNHIVGFPMRRLICNILFITDLFLILGMKEVMVVKIAYQCSDMYADAMKLMQLPSLRDLWPRVRHKFGTVFHFFGS